MEWKIIFYESGRGERPVEVFILKQRVQAQAKIGHAVKLLRMYGSQLGMPQSKQLASGLYELRIRGKDELRIFYTFKQKTIYLLHAFKKQTQKTPKKELEIANQRMTELT